LYLQIISKTPEPVESDGKPPIACLTVIGFGLFVFLLENKISGEEFRFF
jgi:hypothetical protein